MNTVSNALDDLKKHFRYENIEIHCEKHGNSTAKKTYFKDMLKKEAVCEFCENEKNKKTIDISKERKRIAEIKTKMESLHEYKRFINYSLDKYNSKKYPEAQKAYDLVKRYCHAIDTVHDSCANLIMYGGVGSAKTFFAVSILKEAIKKGYTVKYTTAMSLFYEIKETYRDKRKSELEIIRKTAGYDFLVIDEIGGSYESGMEKVTVNHILDQRYLMMKPTICISNLKLEDIKTTIGERALDRLKESGTALHFDWNSLRGRRG